MSDLILLTGASGFIGNYFLKKAILNGWRVRILTRDIDKWMGVDNIEIIKGDLATSVDWSSALVGVQIVVHAAGEIKDFELMPIVNFEGPAKLLNASVVAGVKRWVQLSSSGAFGVVCNGVVTEKSPDNPLGPYETSKVAFDNLLLDVSRQNLIDVVILRPSIVYGVGMRSESIFNVLSIIQFGLFVFLGSPGASANYVHVEDVVQALELCVCLPQAANQIYIVSAWSTIETMVKALADGANKKKLICFRIPLAVAKLCVKFTFLSKNWPLTKSRLDAMSSRCSYSTSKIERELGWSPTNSVSQGMFALSRSVCK